MYELIKKKEQAKRILEQAHTIAPDDAEVLNYLGYFYAENGLELEKALLLIEKALEKKPESGAYLDSMGWVLFKMGKYEKAQEYLKKAGDTLPEDPIVLEHLGDVYEKLASPEKAIEYWKKSLEKKSDNDILRKKLESFQKNKK